MTSVTLPDTAASVALLIGVAAYEDLSPLPATANNVTGLSTAFRDPDLWGLHPGRCHERVDPHQGGDIEDALALANEEVEPDGWLVLYYAGHGLLDSRGDLYLTVTQSRTSKRTTQVPYSVVRDYVRDSPALNRLVILDCCFSGRAFEAMSDPADLGAQLAIGGSCILAAAPANRTAVAPAGASHTAFTHELLSLLRRGVDDGPEGLDLHTIWQSLRGALHANGYPEPQLRTDNNGARLPFVRNAAHHRPHSLVGQVLVAEMDAELGDASLLVVAHDFRGALAIRLNQPTEQSVRAALPEWAELAQEPAVVFDGGPVDRYIALALAEVTPAAAPFGGFTPLAGRLGLVDLSADPGPAREAVTALRVFAGYYGWARGDLERDLSGGNLRSLGEVPESLLQIPGG
ncbi:hypothetical protein Ade02nite_27940 [Paractinoplanes deccanensis]|uniref:Peptidase C14 caspase domain-containing protein n=1 Tax=Paractinoplanes deccanensis TaxID=113561 RepID=A0ABQ3Y2D2_9ACTN|nr:YqgE/AlgH family protein [Actinoplanes deccanensis]GID74153.1 hypothetical protein Ade02nite_27940 [Actinoplanes deccanensis]